jgi:diaminopimelate epimerase
MQGLGNDFIVVDNRSERPFPEGHVPALCDRHFGIGADGVIEILPPRGGGDARMRVINADGSVPEMCGNGLRCVAVWLAESRGLGGELLVETDAGPRACIVSEGTERSVDVDMGVVRVVGTKDFDLGGERHTFTLADAGNPHAIAYHAEPFVALAAIGPGVSTHPSLPAGTNVELVRWDGDVLEVAVWERGAGRTLACGTGACAVVAVAAGRGEIASNRPVRVRLPGGELVVVHDRASGRTRMIGPAREVFRGELSGAFPGAPPSP